MQCDAVAEQLARADDLTAEGRALDDTTQAHVGRCLRCQAEVVQHRKLRRALAALRAEVREAPPALLTELLAVLDEHEGHRPLRSAVSGRRVAYVGGIAVATVAGAAGAIALAARSRRRPLLAG